MSMSRDTADTMAPFPFSPAANPLLDDPAWVRNGIWPRSVCLWLTAFYLALYIIRPWEQIFPSWEALYPERAYVALLFAGVFLSRAKRFVMTGQSLAVLLFFAAVSLCSATALRPSLAWEPFYAYFAVVIIYFILTLVILSPYDLGFIVLSYIGIMFVYLFKAEWEFFVNGQHRYDMGVTRMVGIENTFGGPNALGMSINASLPFALFLWRQRDLMTVGWPEKWRKWLRRALLCYGVLAVTSLVLTNSRSSIVGFVFMVAVLLISSKGMGRKLKYLVGGSLILMLAWSFLPAEHRGRIQTIWAPEQGPANAQTSAEGRIEGYKAGMAMFHRHPGTGVGLGNFVAYRVEYVDGVRLEAHNLVGQLMGEMGLAGAVSFSVLLISILSGCRSTIRAARASTDPTVLFLADLARACRLSLVMLLVLGLFGHNLFRANWLWLAAFSGLAHYMVRQRLARAGKGAVPPGAPPGASGHLDNGGIRP